MVLRESHITSYVLLSEFSNDHSLFEFHSGAESNKYLYSNQQNQRISSISHTLLIGGAVIFFSYLRSTAETVTALGIQIDGFSYE